MTGWVEHVSFSCCVAPFRPFSVEAWQLTPGRSRSCEALLRTGRFDPEARTAARNVDWSNIETVLSV
jgi:hypothetical protein